MNAQSPKLNACLTEYRNHLVLADQRAQEDFDKTVISLSGGALGVSFAFLRDVVGRGPYNSPAWLFLAWLAWLAWGLSATSMLVSYYLSQQALRRAIKQVDAGFIETEKPGGPFATSTAMCNALGGLLFLVGVALMILFVFKNMET
jgi:hypothetical protein